MTTADRIKQDLDYVASAMRREERSGGVPAIYFMWAAIVAIGFALPDFAPKFAGPFWFVSGIGGGLLSWWLGAREGRKAGVNDAALGRRYGYHWLIAGVGFILCGLPAATGRVGIESVVPNFLLVGGLVYTLAGVHLERPLLWSGLVMFAAYVVLALFDPPYTWTVTGMVIALSLLWAGFSSRRLRDNDLADGAGAE